MLGSLPVQWLTPQNGKRVASWLHICCYSSSAWYEFLTFVGFLGDVVGGERERELYIERNLTDGEHMGTRIDLLYLHTVWPVVTVSNNFLNLTKTFFFLGMLN